MPAYRVSLNMRNCLRSSGDMQFRVNCAVLCDVEVGDAAGAEVAAIEALCDCSGLHDQLVNEAHDSPLVEVEHVDPLDGIELHEPDLAWYAPEE